MARVTVYLPDELAKRARARAKRLTMSMSAYLTYLAANDARPTCWPPGFAALFGTWKGTFEESDDRPADELPQS